TMTSSMRPTTSAAPFCLLWRLVFMASTPRVAQVDGSGNQRAAHVGGGAGGRKRYTRVGVGLVVDVVGLGRVGTDAQPDANRDHLRADPRHGRDRRVDEIGVRVRPP